MINIPLDFYSSISWSWFRDFADGRELRAINLPRRVEAGGSLRKKPKIVPPKFYTVPHNRVAEEGETIRFQCAITGHPMPWVVWDKDGVSVTPTARISIKEKDDLRVLEISQVTSEDAGLYRVTLENDVGRTEATARLEIISMEFWAFYFKSLFITVCTVWC